MSNCKTDELIIDEITNFTFYYKCPSCKCDCDFVETKKAWYEAPSICPHCGFNIKAYENEEKIKHIKYIEENPFCQLKYDILKADDYGITKHPQEQMRQLGYSIIDSIPQSIADCWWFTVEKFIEPLPPYLSKIRYEIGCP